jgi:uncharacterized protein (TIGR00159 family)
MLIAFITIRWLDILDVLAVAFLFYQLYKLIRGSVAVNIFIGAFSLYLLWQVVKYLDMHLLSTILGQFMGVGVIALIIVFQQEIRRFFLIIGSKYISSTGNFSFSRLFTSSDDIIKLNYADVLGETLVSMSKNMTGALIIITIKSDLQNIIDSGLIINAEIKKGLIKSIFFKNSPLHDGAAVIRRNKIVAARCLLPITQRRDLPPKFGLRHRAAIGLTETTDALVLIVSEETGQISYSYEGMIHPLRKKEDIIEIVKKYHK